MKTEVPQQLYDLVAGGLSPGATITSCGFNDSRLTFQFQIRWRDLTQKFSIRQTIWEDREFEIIETLSRFIIPYPEATKGGQCFWVSYDDEDNKRKFVQGDFTVWEFLIQSDLTQQPTEVSVRISSQAHSSLERRSQQLHHHDRAFRIVAALWQIKAYIDKHRNIDQAPTIEINSDSLTTLLNPSPAPDEMIRKYVALKLHQAYKGSNGDVQLTFNWPEILYLGITDQDFQRAIKIGDGRDWTIDGLALRPTSHLMELLDKGESPTSPIQQAELSQTQPDKEGPMPTVEEPLNSRIQQSGWVPWRDLGEGGGGRV